jgi:hypothetical protein
MELLPLLIGVVCFWITSFLIDEFPFITILGLHFRSEFVFIPLGLVVIFLGYWFLKKKNLILK